MHCASCGYPEAYHDLGTQRCPRETADRNGRRGTFKAPPPPALRHPWFGGPPAPQRVAAEPAGPTPPPLVPARPPLSPAEYSTSNRGMSAVRLGRKALDLGWDVSPWYWQAYDRAEGCALRLSKGPLRAVALWSRPAAEAGKLTGWKTEYAYAWRVDIGRAPTRMTLTELEGLIT